jgi:multidrug efflux pump subunit AcrA (membrane-fusion protein)
MMDDSSSLQVGSTPLAPTPTAVAPPAAITVPGAVAPPPPPLAPGGDEFLPGPGPWAAQLGKALLVLISLSGVALVVWPLNETVRASGVVRPVGENTSVQSELGGTVAEVLLRPNQTVVAGQLLARLDASTYRDTRTQLLTELATLQRQAQQAREEQRSLEAQAQALGSLSTALTESSRRGVDQAQATLAFDRSELGRYRQLLESGAVPRSLVDEKQARQMVSQSEVLKALQSVTEERARGLNELARLRQSVSQAHTSADELDKQVAERRTRLEEVERALRHSELRSPQAGSVLSTTLRHRGQVIRSGEEVAVLAPLNQHLEVKLQVPARDISQIRPGQRAMLRLSACPTPEYGVLPAQVLSLSADTLPAAEGRQGSFELLLRPERRQLQGRQGTCLLRPGLDVVGDVLIRRTTVLMYLLNKLRLGTA